MKAAPVRGTAHRWLLVVPFIWQVGLIPVVNDVPLQPFSLPFPMFWQMLGIVVTTVVIGIVFALDRRLEAAADAAPGGADDGRAAAGPRDP